MIKRQNKGGRDQRESYPSKTSKFSEKVQISPFFILEKNTTVFPYLTYDSLLNQAIDF